LDEDIMNQSHASVPKTRRSSTSCSRNQLLLATLLLPVTVVFIYFLHHTHLHVPINYNLYSTTSALFNLHGEEKNNKLVHLQAFKKQRVDSSTGTSTVVTGKRLFTRPTPTGGGSGADKDNDDTPLEPLNVIGAVVLAKEKEKEKEKEKGKESPIDPVSYAADVMVDPPIEQGPLNGTIADAEIPSDSRFGRDADTAAANDDDDEATAYAVDGADAAAYSADDHSDIDNNSNNNMEQEEMKKEEEEAVLSVHYGADDKEAVSKNGDDEEEEIEAKQALDYTADDDDEEEKEVEGKGQTSSHTRAKVISSTPRPTKKVYIPGWKDKAKQKKLRAHATGKLLDFESNWGYNSEWKHIEVLPTLKIPLKRDRRVVFPNLTVTRPTRDLGLPPTGIVGHSRELLHANEVLQRHPIFGKSEWTDGRHGIEEVMVYIQQSGMCQNKPIFLSMATVHDDLYWQLIENFVYTMVKFNTSQCSLVICVSDPNCMKLCGSSYFPCYNFVDTVKPLPSVMEQIAKVKLFYIPKALSLGVDILMLDLDVGFLGDPKYMLDAFYATPIVDIMVQVSAA
jgi:hypothetical protein